MKLTTLIEYQRCFNMLREAEMDGRKLSTQEYMDCHRAHSLFDLEFSEHTKPMKVEIK